MRPRDESVAGRDTEIEQDEVRLLLAGGANGGQAVTSGGDFEPGRLKAACERRELEILILDDHDFLSGHCVAYPLQNQKATEVRQLRVIVASRLIMRF